MPKHIGDITLYSVKDLRKALNINERTLRNWFHTGRLNGVKIGTQWHITEENLKKFLNAEENCIRDAGTARKKQKKGG